MKIKIRRFIKKADRFLTSLGKEFLDWTEDSLNRINDTLHDIPATMFEDGGFVNDRPSESIVDFAKNKGEVEFKIPKGSDLNHDDISMRMGSTDGVLYMAFTDQETSETTYYVPISALFLSSQERFAILEAIDHDKMRRQHGNR